MEKVLFIDDEQSVLDGYERLLRREFAVRIALGGRAGLEELEKYGPFAVVISDMRMPGMNGAEFLAQVRRKWPETVRMLLTGYSDINAAVDAVNKGNIYRFLTKPCEKSTLVKAIQAGFEQYRAQRDERDLVQKARREKSLSVDWKKEEICQWDNFLGPTGLPGPTQAQDSIGEALKGDNDYFVVLFKLTVLHTIELRYGEAATADYLNVQAKNLMEALRAEDRLFHWRRDVFLGLLRRQLSPQALQAEMDRTLSWPHQYVIETEGRKVMISGTVQYDFVPLAPFRTVEEVLQAFDPQFLKRSYGT